MRRSLTAALVVVMSGAALAQTAPMKLTLYKTVSSAACSPDRTVWIDPATKTYYGKGDGLYGKTKPGGYNCQKTAEAAGYHTAGARR
jgi:hypothetical protein